MPGAYPSRVCVICGLASNRCFYSTLHASRRKMPLHRTLYHAAYVDQTLNGNWLASPSSPSRLPKIILGVRFIDAVEVVGAQARAAAS